MKNLFKNYFGKGGFALMVLMLVCALLGITDGGAMAANTYIPPTGTEDTVIGRDGLGEHASGEAVTTEVARNITDELLISDYDRKVVKCFPYKTPLDTLMRYANKRNTSSLSVRWGATDIKPFSTKTTAVYTENSAVKTGEISVENPKVFAKTSTVRVDGVYGYEDEGKTLSTKKYLMLYVTKVDAGAKKITVIAANGPVQANGNITDTYVPSIPSGTTLYRMARAGAEKDIQTESSGSIPGFTGNYCQYFICQVDVSAWYEKSMKNVDWDKQDMEEMAIYEWKMEMEGTHLFGDKTIIHDDDKDQDVLTANGIINYIRKEFEYINFTNNDLIDLTKMVFTGNSGSDKRIMFAGSDLIANISKIDYTRFKDISSGTEVKWGITWRVISTNFGKIYLIHHELLDQYGWAGNAIIIDPEYLLKYVFGEEGKRELDLKNTGVSNVESSVTSEVSCAGLKYPACHLIVKNVA